MCLKKAAFPEQERRLFRVQFTRAPGFFKASLSAVI